MAVFWLICCWGTPTDPESYQLLFPRKCLILSLETRWSIRGMAKRWIILRASTGDTVVSEPQITIKLGLGSSGETATQPAVPGAELATLKPVFTSPQDQQLAQIAYKVIQKYANQPTKLPSPTYLSKPEIQAEIVQAVKEQYAPAQLAIEGVMEEPDFAAIAEKTTNLVQTQTINIPRILVVPTGVVRSGYRPFTLKLDSLRYPEPAEEIWIQYLRTAHIGQHQRDGQERTNADHVQNIGGDGAA